jgi:hypothetical protein
MTMSAAIRVVDAIFERKQGAPHPETTRVRI